jgi:Glycosyl hydrolase family 81 C-terminal domain
MASLTFVLAALFNTMLLFEFNTVPTPMPETPRPLVPENKNQPFDETNLFFNFDSNAPLFFGFSEAPFFSLEPPPSLVIVTPDQLTPAVPGTIPPPPSLFQETGLRTNDFQPLQQTLASEQQIIRMGNLYINQGSEGIGIVQPLTQDNSADAITTPTDSVQLLISAVELTTEQTLFNRVSTIFRFPFPREEDEEEPPITTQAMALTYYLQGAPVPPTLESPGSMVDLNVIGNAYHDVRINALTPQLTFTGANISELFVERQVGDRRVGQEEFGRLLLNPGDKFRFTLTDAAGRSQIWLLYVEPGEETISFFVDLQSNTLRATGLFTGFLRVAAVQTDPVTTTRPIPRGTLPGEFWSTAAVAQSVPVSPVAMFLLWPFEWTERFGEQFNTLFQRRIQVPDCAITSSLLPLLAMTDGPSAQFYFDRIPEREYAIGNNRFINQFWIFAAEDLSTAATAYQVFFRPPPSYGITPSEQLTEEAYDASRRQIPITAEVTFNEDQVVWNYECLIGSDPLIIFPGYKTLDTLTPVPGFTFNDPIKGDLFGVLAVDNEVAFSEGPVPGFYETSFIPEGLSFSRSQLSELDHLFEDVVRKRVTATDVLGAGKQTYELALTATLAVFVKERLGQSPTFTFALTDPLMDRVKQELIDWLIIHEKEGTQMPDYFVADNTVGGLTTVVGMSATSEENALIDSNNALYSNHHTQYGWWLMAAALVAQYDEKFSQFMRTPPFLELTQVAQTNRVFSTFQIFDLSPFKMKDFVDMLWRDTRNPDPEDFDLPRNRYGNPWEGHSTANGFLYTPLTEGRFQETWAQDFNSWVAVNQYAKAVLASSTLSDEDKMGFDTLETFSQTNMQLTATSGKLVYHDEDWLYSGPYSINETVGSVFDSETRAETEEGRGIPPCGVGIAPSK